MKEPENELILVIGGAGSGKSEFAENLCRSRKMQHYIYLATMEAQDAESKKRIARHRRMRAGKSFETLEKPFRLEEIVIPEHAGVLLECLSNLAANEMFSAGGRSDISGRQLSDSVLEVSQQADCMVVVTNQVFSDGFRYDTMTQQYQKILGEANCLLAEKADAVYEVVCGIPICLKGLA